MNQSYIGASFKRPWVNRKKLQRKTEKKMCWRLQSFGQQGSTREATREVSRKKTRKKKEERRRKTATTSVSSAMNLGGIPKSFLRQSRKKVALRINSIPS